jgi:hypothetical protein
MSGRDDLHHAEELLGRLLTGTTPAPWRDTTVDGNRYAALVADTCERRCDEWATRWKAQTGEDPYHPHDRYGGCLVAESITAQNRRLLAVLRNVADHLPEILRAVADEDPIAVGRHTRGMAAAIIETHTPRTPA